MTEPKKETTPEEEWATVEALALRAEARERAERPVVEVERGLRAEGVDPERVAREGRALAERLMREAGILGADHQHAPEPDRDRDPEHDPDLDPEHDHDPEHDPDHDPDHDLDEDDDDDRVAHAQPVPPAPSRLSSYWPVLFAAAAAVAVAVPSGVTIALREKARPLETPHDESPVRHEPSPTELALQLRREAEGACARHEWQSCLDKLDDARQIDVIGDETPVIAQLRAGAVAGLTPAEPPSDKLEQKRMPPRDP